MQFINLTPNTITEITTGKSFPPSGKVARLDITTSQINTVDGMPIFDKMYGNIKNLPDPQPNTYYIVSGIMLDAGASQGRTDLVAPGELVKENGKIIGCRGFTI